MPPFFNKPCSSLPPKLKIVFEKSRGKKFELQHVPVEDLRAQKNAAPDDLRKTFAGLMLVYAAGNEINMQHTLKAIPVSMNSVQQYATQVCVNETI